MAAIDEDVLVWRRTRMLPASGSALETAGGGDDADDGGFDMQGFFGSSPPPAKSAAATAAAAAASARQAGAAIHDVNIPQVFSFGPAAAPVKVRLPPMPANSAAGVIAVQVWKGAGLPTSLLACLLACLLARPADERVSSIMHGLQGLC